MASRTTRRNTFSVSADNDDFNINYYNQAEFKGLNTSKNDIAVDPASFADAENVYIDDNSVLISRPPIKLWDNRPWIVKEWVFGQYEFRMQKLLVDDEGNRIDYPQKWMDDWWTAHPNAVDTPMDHMQYLFYVSCISHETLDGTLPDGTQALANLAFTIAYGALGYRDIVPATYVAQIEDKIYFWVAGNFLYDFNTAGAMTTGGTRANYFEESTKYLYFPVHKLIINGIESDLETKNFLTDTYRRRYQYSQLSSVNFDTMVGRKFTVNLNGDMTQDQTQKLYDITIQQNQQLAMIYPFAELGNNYVVDMVQTPRANVFMRYNIVTHIIEVSYDGRIWHALPTLENIVGEPMLTRDGMWCVAFTAHGVAKCQLVAQTTEDMSGEVDYFSWTIVPYAQNNIYNSVPLYFEEINTAFKPHGYFETIDNFAYCFRAKTHYADYSSDITYIYAEWLRGIDDRVWGIYEALYMNSETGTIFDLMPYDDIKLHFKYVAPTQDDVTAGALVSILNAKNVVPVQSSTGTVSAGIWTNYATTLQFEYVEDARPDLVSSWPIILAEDSVGTNSKIRYVYALDSSQKMYVDGGVKIAYGDVVLLNNVSLSISPKTYNHSNTYKAGEYVLTSISIDLPPTTDYILWQALKDVPADMTPTSDGAEEYWQSFGAWNTIYTYNVSPSYSTNELTPPYNHLLTNVNSVSHTIARVTSPSGKTGIVEYGDKVYFDAQDISNPTYSATELQSMFGQFEPDYDDSTNKNWSDVAPCQSRRKASSTAYDMEGYAFIYDTKNPMQVAHVNWWQLLQTMNTTDPDGEDMVLAFKEYNAPADYMDIQASAPIYDIDTTKFDLRIAYSARYESADGKYYSLATLFYRLSIDTKDYTASTAGNIHIDANNRVNYCMMLADSNTVLTDKFIWFPDLPESGLVNDGDIVEFPVNGMLNPVITDETRQVINGDTILLASKFEGEDAMTGYQGNVHKVSSDFTSLSNAQIKSNDVVAFAPYAITEEDYLQPDTITAGSATTGSDSHFYRLQVLGIEFTEEGGVQWSIANKDLVYGALCRLIAYDETLSIPANTATNPTDATMTLLVSLYPTTPSGWEVGDDWPSAWAQYPKPFIPVRNGDTATIRRWQAGDPLPSGEPIQYYGALNITRKVQPLSIGSDGVWLLIDGKLWTSQLSAGNAIELDEYVECDYDDEGNMVPRVNYTVPSHVATLNEHFFSFVYEGKNLLEVSSTRRDEERLFSDKGNDLLLYLPEVNEQVIANTITALHNLSETAMGLFTEDATYYITAVEQDTGSIVYTKPIKSKVPFGLRDGDEVITALDGQALLFPTARGLAAMAPEDFVATTERSVSYLSDSIQDLYADFYSNPTEALELQSDMGQAVYYKIKLHLNTYRYWVLLWREYDKRILLLDTRTGSWWRWETTYPLTIVFVKDRLHFVQNMVFNPYTPTGWLIPPETAPYLGWDCVLCDIETNYDYVNDTDFPTLENNAITYDDATIDGVLNGDITYTDTGFQQVYYAEPRIKWHVVSQKMILNAPNNYKKIRQIIMSAKGTKPISTKLSTKVFRDLVHPEQSSTMEIKINDLRTFVKYINYMHVVYFQYRLENDVNDNTDNQLRLNMLGIKYEVKENIR